MTPVDQAEALAARGQAAAGLAILQRAATTGHAGAAFTLAFWYLVGQFTPRDLPSARMWLRRAAGLGHADAALIEVALTANGSGRAPDWAKARQLLIDAARAGIAEAQEQLTLLRTMDIDPDGNPTHAPVGQIVSAAPSVVHFPLLFTPAECAHVARRVGDLMEPSVVLDPASGRPIPHPIRTSSGAVIGPTREDLVVRTLNQRIAAASGTRVEQGEPLQVLHYAPGQQYRPHHDAIARTDNQRGWTMLIYLNEGYRGGGTRFTATGLTVQGKGGDGLLFRNLDAAGRPDPLSRHAGLPIEAGTKWLATRWIRLAPHDPWTASPDR
jgi:prolyl 4-hydroxylase